MLHNLAAEMVRKGISKRDLAELTGMNVKTIYNKMNGVSEFTFSEASMIRDNYFPEEDLQYLFSTD